MKTRIKKSKSWINCTESEKTRGEISIETPFQGSVEIKSISFYTIKKNQNNHVTDGIYFLNILSSKLSCADDIVDTVINGLCCDSQVFF